MQASEEKLRLSKPDKPQSQDLANSVKACSLQQQECITALCGYRPIIPGFRYKYIKPTYSPYPRK